MSRARTRPTRDETRTRLFEAAARLCSVKHAAAELHVTPAAVSRQIKELERALGCDLFVRQNRKITVTARGQRYAAIVGRAFGEIGAATAELSGARPTSSSIRRTR